MNMNLEKTIKNHLDLESNNDELVCIEALTNLTNTIETIRQTTDNIARDYISKVLSKLTVIGGVFLVIIAGLPIIFSNLSGLPSSVTIGGTSLLIVVGVALETYRQLEGSLVSRNYKRGYTGRRWET